MTDSQSVLPPETPGQVPASRVTALHRIHPALWVVAVLGAFIALGALWFAIFGNPQVIGPDTTGSTVSTSTPSGAATGTVAPITLDDVKDVLAELDYTEANDSSATEYTNTLTHVLAGVDVLTFAQNTLETTSSIWWRVPATDELTYQSGAQKSQTIAESTAAYLKRISTVGEATALSDLMGVRLFPPSSHDRLLPDSQLEVMGQGLVPLGLMFGAQDADSEWAWGVEDVKVTGPRSADVTYSAKTRPGAKWKFLDPSLTYTKHLTFIRTDGGQWRLAGWSNYAQVADKFYRNVSVPGAAALDEWWGAL